MADTNLWRDRNKIFVAGIPLHIDDDGLYEKFKPFGEMFQSKIVYDKNSGRSKGKQT
jgi:RNA recognition motif-containing protein